MSDAYSPTFICSLAVLLLAACGETDTRQIASDKLSVPLGQANVEYNGKTHQLDIWKAPCGNILNDEAYRISAGVYNAEFPNESATHLNLGGSSKDDTTFDVTFVPSFDPWVEVNARETGKGTPSMIGKSFSWSGETLEGKSISITAECP